MSERSHPFPFLHHALKKIACFSKAGVLQTVSLGENQVSLGKSRTPAMRVRERPWRRSCLRLIAWKEELLEVCCDPGTEPLSNTRPCFENTDVNKMMPLYCWEIHSLVVDRDFFFFFFNFTISFPVVKTLPARAEVMDSILGRGAKISHALWPKKSKHKAETIL